jgi:hypothetical protein
MDVLKRQEEYNGTTTDAAEGWDTGVTDLNVFYDVSCLFFFRRPACILE